MSRGSRNEVTQDSDGVRVFCCSSGLPFYLHLSLKNTLEDSNSGGNHNELSH